jgi:hypothetical protein
MASGPYEIFKDMIERREFLKKVVLPASGLETSGPAGGR